MKLIKNFKTPSKNHEIKSQKKKWIQYENHEKNENLKIQCDIYETHEHFKIPLENHENLANPKISFEDYGWDELKLNVTQ